MSSPPHTANRQRIESVFFEALDEVNRLLPSAQRVARALDAALLGADSALDSLGLVNLIVAFEQKIDERFGISVTLVNEESMSQTASPFRTAGALIEYAAVLVNRKAG